MGPPMAPSPITPVLKSFIEKHRPIARLVAISLISTFQLNSTSERLVTFFTRTNSHGLLQRMDKNLAVTNTP